MRRQDVGHSSPRTSPRTVHGVEFAGGGERVGGAGGGVAEDEVMEGMEEKEEQPGSSVGEAHGYIEPCESLSGSQ